MKWLHRLLRGVSCAAALFVFQACYGTPPVDDMMYPEEPVENLGETSDESIAELPTGEVTLNPES